MTIEEIKAWVAEDKLDSVAEAYEIILDLVARCKRATEYLEGLGCEDCQGNGVLPQYVGEKPFACETCGGHEDARGDGAFCPDPDELKREIDALENGGE